MSTSTSNAELDSATAIARKSSTSFFPNTIHFIDLTNSTENFGLMRVTTMTDSPSTPSHLNTTHRPDLMAQASVCNQGSLLQNAISSTEITSIPDKLKETILQSPSVTDQSPKMALQFTFFPKLPLELQLMVWENLEQLPRTFNLVRKSRKDRESEIEITCYSAAHAVPPLLHVNRESRTFALKYNKLLFSKFPIYFCPGIDAICFEDKWLHNEFFKRREICGPGDKLLVIETDMKEKLQLIIVRCEWYHSEWLMWLLSLNGAKDISIVLEECAADDMRFLARRGRIVRETMESAPGTCLPKLTLKSAYDFEKGRGLTQPRVMKLVPN